MVFRKWKKLRPDNDPEREIKEGDMNLLWPIIEGGNLLIDWEMMEM
jgi:hypothetical protein